jgi:WD40 repeat protein
LQATTRRIAAGLSFGPDGRLLASSSGGVDVWDLATGGHTFLPCLPSSGLFACVCDPLGRWFYLSEPGNGCRVLDFTGAVRQPLPGDPADRHVVSLALAADGSRVLVSRGGGTTNRLECWAVDGGVLVPGWAVRDGQPVDPRGPFTPHQGWFSRAVAFSPDGRTVATTESRSSFWIKPTGALREAASGELRKTLALLGDCLRTHMIFTPDGATLLAWGEGLIEFWDVATGRRAGTLRHPGRAHFHGLAIHPSGQFFLTAGGDSRARYWDLASRQTIQSFKWPVGKLHSLALSPDGTLAAAGSDKGQIVVWDVDI